jgi:hypothetical protein
MMCSTFHAVHVICLPSTVTEKRTSTGENRSRAVLGCSSSTTPAAFTVWRV